MKKFKIAALLMCFVAMSFAMTSCSKSNEDLIIGKWKLTKVEGNNAAYSNESIGSIWEFKADKTFAMTMSSFSMNGTYTIEDDVLSVTMSAYGFSETTKMNIKTLNKSSMVLSDPDDANNTATFEKQ